MPYHNFKILGSHYTSKCGHDSNPGTDPNAPKRSLATGFSKLVVGAGTYAIGRVNLGVTTAEMVADGKVMLVSALSGYALISGNTSTDNRITATGFHFRRIDGGVATAGNGTSNRPVEFSILEDCIGFGSTNSRGRTLSNNLIIDCTGGIGVTIGDTTGSTNYFNVEANVIVNSVVNANRNFQNNYVGPNSTIFFNDFNEAQVLNNCIRGRIVVNGVSYELKRKKNGSPAEGTNPAVADLITIAPNIYANKNFNEAPKFNDASGRDFSLQSDSPLIRATTDGAGNIGGYFAKIATSVQNTDNGNESGTVVQASPEINTAVPLAYELHAGEEEGYVDYVFANGGLAISNLDLKDVFNFDSDIAGGALGNKNVPDAEPVTSDYARLTSTTAANANLNQVTVGAGVVSVGQHVRVLGQCREVVAASGGVLTLDSNLLATVGAGVEVTYGTMAQLAAINPNRLTVLMRTKSTSSTPSFPMVAAEWDNELDAAYGVAGRFFNQEVNTKPGYYIDGMQVYGAGDSSAPTGLPLTELAPQWVNIRVYKRNNYSSKGLAS